MPVTPIRSLVAVFPPDGAGRFTVDAIELLLSPRSGAFGAGGAPGRPDESALMALLDGKRVVPSRTGDHCYFAPIESGGLLCFQRLSSYRNGQPGQVSCVVRSNLLRRVKARLISAGKYRPPLHASTEPDNCLDPSRLAADVDLHRECLVELDTLAIEAAAAYRTIVERLFHVRLAPADVQASIHQIELTWDRPCVVARHVPTCLWPGWRAAFRGAGRSLGFSDEDYLALSSRITTPEREPTIPHGVLVLRAVNAKGHGAKLYARIEWLIRFEVELTGPRLLKLNGGRAPMLSDTDALRRLLLKVAEPAYAALLRAQEGLTSAKMPTLGVVMDGFHRAGSARVVRGIVEAFEVGDHFFHRSRAHEKALTKLRNMGWAVHLVRGEWVASPEIAAFFALVNWRVRADDSPAAAPAATRKLKARSTPSSSSGGSDA